MRNVNFSQTTIDLRLELTEAVKDCNDARAEGKPYAEKGGLLDTAKAKAKAVNKAIIADVCEELKEMAKADLTGMLRSYMQDWTVMALAVKDSEDGVAVSEDGVQRIDFRALDNYCTNVKITSRGDWSVMLDVLVDNLLTDWAKGEKVDKKSLPAKKIQEREKLGENWIADGKPRHTNEALKAQADEIIKAIFPAEMRIPFRKQDIRVLQDVAKDYKDNVGNTALEFRAVTGRKIERRFFQLVYTRMNDLAIVISDDYDRENGKGQPAGQGEKPAAGGPVKVVDDTEKPAKKSTAKAATKPETAAK